MNETRRTILSAIADGPVPGPALADRLDVSRNAVWKHVEALREDGFGIDSGRAGYALVDVPEFGGPAVEFGLDAPFRVEFHDTIPSTNARARALASRGAEDVVVLADEQTAGRGRLDRSWASPGGGVWLSILLRPDLPPTSVPTLTLAAGVAAVAAIEPTGVEAGLKWPNDVLVADGGDQESEQKLAGILTEMEGEADRTSWVVVGLGLNANVDADELPPGATSLRALVGDVDRGALVRRFLEAFDDLRADPDAVLPAWRDVSLTIGRSVQVETATGEVVGQAVDVEHPGRLVIETDEGRVGVHAGDCEHLRPP